MAFDTAAFCVRYITPWEKGKREVKKDAASGSVHDAGENAFSKTKELLKNSSIFGVVSRS